MPGTFLDVDAPNTNWRGSEDPIPVIFGRLPLTGAVYRYLTCRPLDGHARTDATFLHPGTRAFTRSGRTGPWNYMPGWKRGLLLTRIPPLLGGWTGTGALYDGLNLNDAFGDPWWLDPYTPMAFALPIVGYGAYKGVTYVRGWQFNRHYVQPVYRASVAAIRTRDSVKVEIVPGLVHGRDPLATGRIYVPASLVSEGDRDNLLDAVRERLGHDALDGRWNMEGTRPHVELFTPPQPPDMVTWDMALAHADMVSPYLGHAAGGPVHWDMGDDSPHIGIAGGSGSGKSELVAWVVGQFMRGGAGTVVLDPKWVSHRWMSRVPEVLYCREAAMIHDTVLWLDAELRRRGAEAVKGADDFERIVVVLEERNSLQTVLRDYWQVFRPRGAPMRSPALAALDRLASMGRSFNLNVVLAAQEVTKADIGSRNNFGAFALAGRLPVGAWRLVNGPGSKKPAMSSKPGRFGYAVAGTATVFQAAFPDLKQHEDRLIEWATSGEPLLDVRVMMQQHQSAPFPSSEPAASDEPTEEYVTLREFVEAGLTHYSLAALRLHSQRDGRAFPDPQGTGAQNAKLYRLTDLVEWQAIKQEEDGDA